MYIYTGGEPLVRKRDTVALGELREGVEPGRARRVGPPQCGQRGAGEAHPCA